MGIHDGNRSGSGPRILIVEDEPTVRLVIARTLEARGYVVIPCGTGAEALAHIASDDLDLLVLDVNLPDITGWEVIRRAREGHAEDVPVIVMSAVTPRMDRVREFGVAGVLNKPFPLESLVDLVGRSVRRPEPTTTSLETTG